MYIRVILILIIVFCFSTNAYASDISGQIDALDYTQTESLINKSIRTKIDFKQLSLAAIKGELDLSPGKIINSGVKLFLDEVLYNASLIKSLLILVILSAVLSNLTDSFKNKAAGELGFYVCYMALVTVLFASFNVAAGIISELIGNLAGIMQASLPMMLSLMVMSGNITGAYLYNPIILFVINILTVFLKDILLPLIVIGAAIKIINYMTEREFLSQFGDLIKNGTKLTLKGTIIFFIALLSLQKISAPILNNIAVKTAKTATNAIPVVGGILNSAVDSVLIFSSAAKSGVMIALIIGLIMACAVPLLKVFAVVCMFKIIAAIIEPITDKRIVKCVDAAGSFSIVMLGVGVTVAIMFLITIIILLSF